MNDQFCKALAQLPHGEDFRFIDEIISLVPGKEATGIYLVKQEHPIIAAHFPGKPMLPGVILIEAIAQLCGVVINSVDESDQLHDLRLTGIRSAKILGAAAPGELLSIYIRIEARMGNLVQAEGNVTGPQSLLASAKVILSGTPAA